jgi:hypothetical protein
VVVTVAVVTADPTEELLPQGHLAETKVLATALERYADPLEPPNGPQSMASTNLRRCRTLLLLRDLSVLARMRHPSASAHHPVLLEPCDIDQRRRTRTNEHETDSDLRAYRTDATKEVTSTGKEETYNEEGGHSANSESATGYTIATKKTALAVAAVDTKMRTPTTDGLRRGAHPMSRLGLNTHERTTADSI